MLPNLWSTAALRVVKLWPYIVGAVHAVEAIAGAARGQEKQDAAIIGLRATFAAVEPGHDRELLDDPHVEQALRAAIDSYVQLQNVIAAARGERATEVP